MPITPIKKTAELRRENRCKSAKKAKIKYFLWDTFIQSIFVDKVATVGG